MVWIRSWSFMVTITVVASRWTFVVTVLHRRAEKMYQTIKSTWPEVCSHCTERIFDRLKILTRYFVHKGTKQKQQTNGNRAIWLVYRTDTNARGFWLVKRNSGEKTSCPELSRNQSILRFDVTLQLDWAIEQCILNVRVFFGGKTKSSCFHLFIHCLIKQITNT